MKYDPDIHHRRSIRLKEYDYASAGLYFVTVCVHGRECLFGEINNGDMKLNDAGRVIEGWWQAVTDHFANVALDKYMIMPNHFHGIVVITDVGAGFPRPMLQHGKAPPRPALTNECTVGAGSPCPISQTPTNKGGETPPLPTLGQIVGYFKYQTTKQINLMRDNPGCPVWQRNYYERVIRNERELAAARKYIVENPIKWDLDKENPVNMPRPTDFAPP